MFEVRDRCEWVRRRDTDCEVPMSDSNTGDSERFEYHNRPEPEWTIKPVGTTPKTTYHVDWPNRPDHPPEAISKLHTAQVKLAVAGTDIRDFEEFDAAISALNELVAAVTDYYVEDRESQDWYNLYMGNLDELPGVEKEVENVPVCGETGDTSNTGNDHADE